MKLTVRLEDDQIEQQRRQMREGAQQLQSFAECSWWTQKGSHGIGCLTQHVMSDLRLLERANHLGNKRILVVHL